MITSRENENVLTTHMKLTNIVTQYSLLNTQVTAGENSLVRGYLSMSKDNRIWDKRYVAVHEDFVLYVYGKPKDVAALFAIPLPGQRSHGTPCSALPVLGNYLHGGKPQK